MRPIRAAFVAALILCPSFAARAGAPVVVNQIRRAFSVRDVHVHRGDIVRFNNADEFLHQLHIVSK